MTRTPRGALLAPILALGLTWACKPQETPPAAAQSTDAEQGPQAPSAQPVSQGGATRTEKDLLGSKEIPANAYYGVQTARALENFQISGVPINHYPGFIEAWAIVKLAAAQGNTDVGAMKKDKLAAIEKAANALLQGKYHDQFTVDWYQGGAGTSTNMNANEVMANIGLELTGHKKGDYEVLEPHDDLNQSQSTNDSYPTAIKIALILRNGKLIAELQKLAASFRAKGDEYMNVVKMGRTELQDAVPMTVGQEFHAFASSLDGEIQLLGDAEKYLYTVNMGATAIGTGLNAPKGYAERTAAHLAKLTGKPIKAAPGHAVGHLGPAGLRGVLLGDEERRDQAVQDRQRPDPAHLRPARWARGNQSSRAAAGILDHAGQGESGHSRAGQPRGVPGDGERLHASPSRRTTASFSSTPTSRSRVWP